MFKRTFTYYGPPSGFKRQGSFNIISSSENRFHLNTSACVEIDATEQDASDR